MSWKFYRAQRSGPVPPNNDIPWRNAPSHMSDPVVGGWYDAGDFLKLNFPLAPSVGLLAWGLIDFKDAYTASGLLGKSRNTLRIAADYLHMSYDSANQTYIGQIGDPDIDHAYWGRPEDEKNARPGYTYTPDMAASDLYGGVAGALAATSIVFQGADSYWAGNILQTAEDLYGWAVAKKGKYSAFYKKQTASIYPSSDYLDSLAWAAGWLYHATNNASYLNDANTFWQQGQPDVFPGWDSLWATHAIHMVGLMDQGVVIPGIQDYVDYVDNQFLKAWFQANGKWSKCLLLCTCVCKASTNESQNVILSCFQVLWTW